MTRFIHWRKMTWAMVLWSGVTLVWMAFGSGNEGVLLVSSLWTVGLACLTLVWFMTRPLWRQGHGARLRRLRSDDLPWMRA